MNQLKLTFIAVLIAIGGLISKSTGQYIVEGSKGTIVEGIGTPIGDILVIIGNSILTVYIVLAIIVVAIISIDYLVNNSSNGRYW